MKGRGKQSIEEERRDKIIKKKEREKRGKKSKRCEIWERGKPGEGILHKKTQT